MSTANNAQDSLPLFEVPSEPEKPRTKVKKEKPKLSPMLSQYVQHKEDHPDCLIFCQVGDFYELFFEDAVTVSRSLNLTLTSRDKNQEKPIPMCGVPISVVDGYVDRLVDLGFSVAIVSQTSLPEPGKMVERALERIVTPAIRIMGGAQTDTNPAGGVLSIIPPEVSDSMTGAVAYSEIESGHVTIFEPLDLEQIVDQVYKLLPSEIILPQEISGKKVDLRSTWVKRCSRALKNGQLKFKNDSFLSNNYSQEREFNALNGYSSLGSAAKKATKLLLNYIDETTVNTVVNIESVQKKDESKFVSIDATTRRNLELLTAMKDSGHEGSLFGYLNKTVSSGGTRLLRDWILHPLLDIKDIESRHKAVGALKTSALIRTEIQALLGGIPDLERIASRMELQITTPRELASLRDGVKTIPDVLHQIDLLIQSQDSELLLVNNYKENIVFPETLYNELEAALVDNPPMILHDGGYIKDSYDSELLRLRSIRSEGKAWLTELERKEREATGIQSLKVKFNNVLGFYIEVTKSHLKKVPDRYIKRQSMVSAERFTTPELKGREEEILQSESRQIAREKDLFEKLRQDIKQYSQELRSLYRLLSELDVLSSFAKVAEANKSIEPKMVAEPVLNIEKGRHPVLDQILKQYFIPNDLEFSIENTCLILTGPNMGGKSTYLRQAALLVLMAQMGAYIPACSATIGIVDKIFARLGASDDIAEGDSTFMVEMKEAALILSQATDRSFVLIDEIGRGTATRDGHAIAQSILESIITDLHSRTLFATHFHELTLLEETHQNLKNISVGSVEDKDRVIFTHEICEGAASHSYGIEVADMAGLPNSVLERAKDLLESSRIKEEMLKTRSGDQPIAVSGKVRQPKDYKSLQKLKARVEEINVEETTPIEALNRLHELKNAIH